MEADFIKFALGNTNDAWRASQVDQLSNFAIPDSILGRRRGILKGDINEQWARWFVESLIDPRTVARDCITYPYLFEEVLKVVENRFSNSKTKPERQLLASISAKIILSLSLNFNHNKRKPLDIDDKRLLLGISGTPPRCWICGAEFKEEAIENFLFSKKDKFYLPPFVDILKPRGLVQRDYSIEADHVVPFSKGGSDEMNLELACGWCNKHKSAFISIYDVEGSPRVATHNKYGLSTLPHPFWIIRLLALRRQCEHPDGCDRSVDTDEMTIVAINKEGALNPSNLRITCYEHDPIQKDRRQPPAVVKKLWGLD